MSTYNVTGSVRGTLAKNVSLADAVRIHDRDHKACSAKNSGGGLTRSYSDARILRADGEPLNDEEFRTASELRDQAQ